MLSRHAIDRFNIVQAVPLNATKTYEELAWASMLPVKTIRQLIRHAMTQRIFWEPQPGHVSKSGVSIVYSFEKLNTA